MPVIDFGRRLGRHASFQWLWWWVCRMSRNPWLDRRKRRLASPRAISCLSIPPEREEFIDFSHSFYETHLAIAVRQQGFLALLAGFLSNRQALMILGGVPGLAALVCGLFFLL